jgi:hypothetical protein
VLKNPSVKLTVASIVTVLQFYAVATWLKKWAFGVEVLDSYLSVNLPAELRSGGPSPKSPYCNRTQFLRDS